MCALRLVLPSNSSPQYHPDNTLTSYTVKLPQALDLTDGEYEVGLSEISYPKSWLNMIGGHMKIEFTDNSHQPIMVPLSNGYYSSVQEVIRMLEDLIRGTSAVRELHKDIRFSIAEHSRKVYIYFTTSIKLTLSDSLRDILGFTYNELQAPRGAKPGDPPNMRAIQVSDRPYDIHRGFYHLYVYCSLCAPNTVGDVEARLLRIISIPTNSEHFVNQTQTFNKIQYVPIGEFNPSSISVYLLNDMGERIHFTSGKTVTTIEIRRKHSLL